MLSLTADDVNACGDDVDGLAPLSSTILDKHTRNRDVHKRRGSKVRKKKGGGGSRQGKTDRNLANS